MQDTIKKDTVWPDKKFSRGRGGEFVFNLPSELPLEDEGFDFILGLFALHLNPTYLAMFQNMQTEGIPQIGKNLLALKENGKSKKMSIQQTTTLYFL